MNNSTTIEKIQLKHDKVYCLACQMLVAIVILSLWCISLIYSNYNIEDKYQELEKEILRIANTHE